jgi:general secretion pathway protein E
MAQRIFDRDIEEAFGELLVAKGILAKDVLERAERLRAETSDRLVTVLTQLGLAAEDDLAAALCEFTTAQRLGANELPPAPVLPDRLSAKFLARARALPVAASAGQVVLAMADPLDEETIDAVRYATDASVTVRVATASQIARAFERLYGRAPGGTASQQLSAQLDAGATTPATRTEDAERLKDQASEAPAIRLVNLWLDRAVEAGASDIHMTAAA